MPMKRTTQSLLLLTLLFLLGFFPSLSLQAQSDIPAVKDVSLNGLSFRSIGPAITGGRVVALAVNPTNHHEYYVGSGHGSLWKTTNNGITYTPVFDNENSFAIGAVTLDPSNPNIVWVGTGENNNQSNSMYGDGVYKSEDGGKNWKNMGLKDSYHIGGIVIDPNDSQTVYVAAYGAQRRGNEERGIFKSSDGGETWKKVLYVSQYTGAYEVHMDPRHSNILYAVMHQRMRTLFTSIIGGPETAIYRSIDHGKTWIKMTTGLPTEQMGRIGLAISPVNSDIVFAIVEATKGGGVYRSTDRGVSWEKRSDHVSAYPFYFQKIFCDTKDVDRLYSMDILMQVSIDGGATWKNAGEDKKHVDDHVLWINPDNNKHLISGCDGGVYESFDQAKNWDFKANIPITEIYKVTADNATPFYNVYIGTQDNNSLGGPSRTTTSSGITNRDWVYTEGGDGFQSQVDWKDPNIVYSQSQFGGLARFNKKTGERLHIKPYDFDDKGYRFDWDAPLLISKFDNKRLYFAAHTLFRTDDMGSTWKEISPDLTRGVPDKMQNLMDRSWSIDELAQKGSMGQLSTIAESPLDENMLYTGSADGLIHYTSDGGQNWNTSATPGLPKYARISQIITSHFDKNVAYAACQNLLEGDFKPYVLKTTNQGKSWAIYNGNLPERGSTYTIAEDNQNKNLLFVGTNFGVFFTVDGGKEWIQLKNGIPTACVMHMEIQRRENDLVVSTFGRGVYILDDYTPLRSLTSNTLAKEAEIFPIKKAKMYIESDPFGFSGVGFQGASFYAAPNPEVGAMFTYYIKEEEKSLKEQRREEEKHLQEENEDVKYPSYDQLRKEADEIPVHFLFTITNEVGNVIRKIKTAPKKGVNRITWDFRHHAVTPASLKEFSSDLVWNLPDVGYMVVPGTYKVGLSKFENGTYRTLVEPQSFACEPLHAGTMTSEEMQASDEFNKKVASLTQAIVGADAYRKWLSDKLDQLEKAAIAGESVPNQVYGSIPATKKELEAFNRELNGDGLRARYEGATPTSLKQRVDLITEELWRSTVPPTTTFKKSYEVAANEFGDLLKTLRVLDKKVKTIESQLEEYGAPYTLGRFPEWDRY